MTDHDSCFATYFVFSVYILLGDESLNVSGLNDSAIDSQEESGKENTQDESVEQAQEAVEV